VRKLAHVPVKLLGRSKRHAALKLHEHRGAATRDVRPRAEGPANDVDLD